jgi:hypothetical protein
MRALAGQEYNMLQAKGVHQCCRAKKGAHLIISARYFSCKWCSAAATACISLKGNKNSNLVTIILQNLRGTVT